MWVIRVLIALLFAALVILIDLPLHLITWLIEKASPGSCTKFRHGYARFAMKGLWLLAGGKATVIGLEKVPQDRAVCPISTPLDVDEFMDAYNVSVLTIECIPEPCAEEAAA